MPINALSVNELSLFLSFFPNLKIQIFSMIGTRYIHLPTDSRKSLRYLTRQATKIALLTSEDVVNEVSINSPRYGLDISTLDKYDVRWVCEMLSKRTDAIEVANITRNKRYVEDRSSNGSNRTKRGYWESQPTTLA